MRARIIGGALLWASLAVFPVAARAGANVNIGINLGVLPPLVAVPASPVVYAPSVSANYFGYGGQFYVFTGGAWYVSGGFNGPWSVLGSAHVPPPILAVPVRYYRRPPPAWRDWRHDAPPHWKPGRGRGHGHGRHG
jgi:hypothetical protein